MLALRTCVVCLLVAALAAQAPFEKPSSANALPDKWWLITDEDPFLSLLAELGDEANMRLRGGPVSEAAAPPPPPPPPPPPSRGTTAPPRGETASAPAPSRNSGSGGGASRRRQRPATTTRPTTDSLVGPTGSFGSFGSLGRPQQKPNATAAQSTATAGARDDERRFGQRPARPIVFPTEEVDEVELISTDRLGSRCSCSPAGSCPGAEVADSGCREGDVCCREQRYRPKCGRFGTRSPKKQGVQESDAPWSAALLEQVPGGFVYLCGGALIHPQVVLTAARCVDMSAEKKKSLVVRLGERDFLSTQRASSYVEMEVKDVVIHRNYSRQNKFNDAALLFLTEPVTLRPNIDTICVRPEVNTAGGCAVHAFGLQATGSKEFDLRLRGAYQAPMSYIDCQRSIRNWQKGQFFSLHPSFLCTRSDVTCDRATDRAGSSLTCRDLTAGEHRLYGIVSWGVGCGANQQPGVYTSAQQFYQWINYHVTDYFSYIESYFGPLNQV